MQFTFLDGSKTNLIGAHQEHPDRQDPGYYPNASYGYSGHYLSSVHINGMGHSGSADCVVYGFKYLNGSPPVSLRTLRTLYITSPQERSAADFARAFPTYGITAALITDELKTTREAYWDSIKVRAEALK